MEQSYSSDGLDGELVKQAVMKANVGVWQLDIATNNLVWSDTLHRLMGTYKDQELKFEEVSNSIHPEDFEYVQEAVQHSIANDEHYSLEYRIIRPIDGRTIWMNFTGQVIKDAQGNPQTMVGTGFEITHLKEAELKAESADRAKSEFLANMSHEIRTPMNGIMGMCDVLMRRDVNSEHKELLSVIQRSGDALLTIINDILDFSKIESGQMELSHAPFDLKSSIEDVTALLANAKKEANVDVLVRYQPSLPSSFIGDGGRLRQIITNIVGNAIKFTKKGHVLVDINGQVKGDEAALTVSISDTGIGIPKDRVDAIFEKFRQADNSTTRRFGGTGLGLSIARSFIELMGGDLTVESEVDVGSTFSFTINLPVDKALSAKPIMALSQQKLNVLIVDDSDVNRDILKEMLSHWGWRSAAAASAKDGLTVLQKAYEHNLQIDVIVLDYQMPVHDGEDFLVAMRKQSRFDDIPVIFLSSVDSVELSQRLQGRGAFGFMTKPARSSALFNQINEAVHGARLSRDVRVDEPCIKPVAKESQVLVTQTHQSEIDILIAEDNEVNQIFVKHVMDDFDYTYKIVENGRVAIEKWKLLRPKLILMDVSMPQMNGYEATRTIRDIEKAQRWPRTPIIALTAHVMKGDREKCLAVGMDDYLSKPLSIDKLQEALNKWLLAAQPQEIAVA